MDTDARVLGQVGVAALVVGHRPLARPRVVGDAVARHLLVRPGGPVARDRAEHEAPVRLPQPLVGEAALGQRSGTHGLDHDVGVLGQVQVDLHAFGLPEVDGDRALAPVDVEGEQRAVALAGRRLDDGPRHLAPVVALRWLDLDDVGAQVGQQPAQLGGPEHRALDDSDAGEQRVVVRHRANLLRLPLR